MFSEVNAFALLMGVRMLNHGWPQSFVVSRLRQAHEELAKRHRVVLSVAPRSPQQAEGEPEMAFSYPDSPFLLVVSDENTDHPGKGSYVIFFDNQEVAFRFQMKEVGRSCSWFGLEGVARALHEHLISSLPKPRGRSV